jgi:uncharacterized protein (DUF2126 family)
VAAAAGPVAAQTAGIAEGISVSRRRKPPASDFCAAAARPRARRLRSRPARAKLGELAKKNRSKLPPLPPDFDPNRRPVQGQSAPWIIRTALCVEPRDGRLHIFMPPVETTEDYLDLIAGIETAVTEMGTPVIIEGETPPRDPRLNKLAVTPDPGVIEVNLHPSKSGMNWSSARPCFTRKRA